MPESGTAFRLYGSISLKESASTKHSTHVAACCACQLLDVLRSACSNAASAEDAHTHTSAATAVNLCLHVSIEYAHQAPFGTKAARGWWALDMFVLVVE